MGPERRDDQRRLLAALAQEGVAFIVIGGHAVAAHGFARGTRDVDMVFATTEDGCARLARVLNALEASVALADLPAPGGVITGEWLAAGGQFVFRTRHGTLEAFSWIAGNDYDTLDPNAITVALDDGTEFRVCGYEDLVAMKRQAGRPQDEEDLRQLRTLDPDR